MRVEAYNQVAQLYNREKTQKVQNTKQMSTGRDEVQISSMGRDYQIAKQAVADASDIREDKVSQLKSMIDAGTYSVEPGDFASKLLEKYNA